MKAIINLTGYTMPTWDALGIIQPEKHDDIADMMRFYALPSKGLISGTALLLADIAAKYDSRDGVYALIDGPSYLLPTLADALKARGICPIFPHFIDDGDGHKVFVGFVELLPDPAQVRPDYPTNVLASDMSATELLGKVFECHNGALTYVKKIYMENKRTYLVLGTRYDLPLSSVYWDSERGVLRLITRNEKRKS